MSKTTGIELASVAGAVTEVVKGKGESATKQNIIYVAADEKSYVDNLPEGITLNDVKAVAAYNTSYVQTVVENSQAVGEKLLNENKDANAVKFIAPYLGDAVTSRSSSVEVVVDRAVERRNPQTQEITNNPSLSVKVINKSESLPASFLSNIKKQLHENIK